MATNGAKTDLNFSKEQTVFRQDWIEGSFIKLSSNVAQNQALSFRARGILIYALSLPKDWDFSMHTFLDSGEGRYALNTALSELKAAGYLRIDVIHENGRIKDKVWRFFDTPQTVQVLENQTEEKPQNENPAYENCTPTNNINTNNTGFINKPTTTTTAQACEATPTNNIQKVVVVDIWKEIQEHPNRDAILEVYKREKDKIRDEKAWLFAMLQKQEINLLKGKKPISEMRTQTTPSLPIPQTTKPPVDPEIEKMVKSGMSPSAMVAALRKQQNGG